MWLLGGTAGATGLGLIAALLATSTTGNLPADRAAVVRVLLVLLAVALGFLAGSAVLDRAKRSQQSLARFCATAIAIALGLQTAVAAVALTAAYTMTYVQWPDGLSDKVLLVLAYPAFAAAGFAVGALFGYCVGLAVGGALKALWRPDKRKVERPAYAGPR